MYILSGPSTLQRNYIALEVPDRHIIGIGDNLYYTTIMREKVGIGPLHLDRSLQPQTPHPKRQALNVKRKI